ncbi:MAG: alpha/beta fold hydrolase [Leptolyngbya sp. SIO1E4]|nr:alpha/beta fold hydrolase [Leptolyngbya sp. SIO1E4]
MPQPYFSGFDPLPSDIETRLMPEAKPQSLTPNPSADAVVICLHGFTGTPYEVGPAVRAIADKGLSVVVPLLPGHGYRDRAEQKQKFARITPDGMLAAVRQEIARARERYRHVGMFGFSMGGAIALTMAAEGLLDVCAVAAPALRLPRKAEILIPLLSWASFTLAAPITEEFYLPAYEFYHSRALRTLWQLSRHAQQQLPQIHCPMLAVHSHNDLTVPPVVLQMMQARMAVQIETAWFDNSGHSMLLDASGPVVSTTIAEFFSRQFIGEAVSR